MKNTVKELLNILQILPLSNPQWRYFDVCLYSDSTPQEYEKVKKKICTCVPKGKGGIYVITKNEKILYIGESAKNIHIRVRRHIDKIFARTDARSDFFKLNEHQGKLSIYYWILPPHLIEKRKAIEYLLTTSLEPEYKKWDLQNKMTELKTVFQKE